MLSHDMKEGQKKREQMPRLVHSNYILNMPDLKTSLFYDGVWALTKYSLQMLSEFFCKLLTNIQTMYHGIVRY